MIKKIVLVIVSSIFSIAVLAQSFEAKIITGFAASQIDGDGLAGYNQLGGILGFATNFEITENIKFQQEIAYYGRGSRINPNKIGSTSFRYKGLHYIDIDALLNYHIDDNFFIQGGLGYGNLIYLRTDVSDDATNYQGDIFWTAGVGYYISDNIIGLGRFQYSLLSAHKFTIHYNNSINFSLRFILN